MNQALGRFDGLFTIPLCQVIWSFCTITSGGFFFREFESFDGKHLCLFGCGVCWNFIGVFLLQPRSAANPTAREPARAPSFDGCSPDSSAKSNPWWMGLGRAGMQPCGPSCGNYWIKDCTKSRNLLSE